MQLLSKNGLIVDVRDNGGGYICASECLLQVLTPNRIKPEPMQFINTPLTFEICRRNIQGLELSSWINSINLSIETGATFSQSFSLTSEKSCNTIDMTENVLINGNVDLINQAAGSRNINDGSTQIDLEIPLQGASFVELRGFDDNRHVTTLKESI